MSSTKHPAHYGAADDPYEAIKVIQAWSLNFALGNVIKYVRRCDQKGSALGDLRKAREYLDMEIEARESAYPLSLFGDIPKDLGFDPDLSEAQMSQCVTEQHRRNPGIALREELERSPPEVMFELGDTQVLREDFDRVARRQGLDSDNLSALQLWECLALLDTGGWIPELVDGERVVWVPPSDRPEYTRIVLDSGHGACDGQGGEDAY